MEDNTITNMVDHERSLGHEPFHLMAAKLADRFLEISDERPVFIANVVGSTIWEAYLNTFEPKDRQHFTCNACKSFIQRYGHLVYIDDNLQLQSAIWDASVVPAFYKQTIETLRKFVLKRGVAICWPFYSSEYLIGHQERGGWNHFFARVGEHSKCSNLTKEPHEISAEKKQNFITVSRAISEFDLGVAKQALGLLRSDSLYRSEKVLGVAEAFHTLHQDILDNPLSKTSLLWLYVAKNPDGFCHIKSSMIGTLLEDISIGRLSGTQVARRFKDKMDPTKYQRPTAAPSDGNIEQAEKIVKEMGFDRSLLRRFARIDEVPLIWAPHELKDVDNSNSGVFGHLKSKSQTKEIEAPEKRVTWAWFVKNVLNDATKIEVEIQSMSYFYNLCGFLTATYDDAPCLFQWGNHFSQYVYVNKSNAISWGLPSFGYVNVTGIVEAPHMWANAKNNGNHGDCVVLILEGCKDTRMRENQSGLALFPEALVSSLHGVRSTIEAFSRKGTLSGYSDASVCGLKVQKGENYNTNIRVTTNLGIAKYQIDMWE